MLATIKTDPFAMSRRAVSRQPIRLQRINNIPRRVPITSARGQRGHRVARLLICSASAGGDPPPSDSAPDAVPATPDTPLPGDKRGRTGKRTADSSDPIASFLTRRFGLAGGLAWLGFLTFGVVSEQVKTRLEFAREQEGTKDLTDAVEVATASGLRYVDLRRGGGELAPQIGFLLQAHLTVTLSDAAAGGSGGGGGGGGAGPTLFDTKSPDRPISWFFGARPFKGALCAGLEEAVSSMRVGGVRKVTIPAALAFPEGARFPGGEVPAGAALMYRVELLRVSPPPS